MLNSDNSPNMDGFGVNSLSHDGGLLDPSNLTALDSKSTALKAGAYKDHALNELLELPIEGTAPLALDPTTSVFNGSGLERVDFAPSTSLPSDWDALTGTPMMTATTEVPTIALVNSVAVAGTDLLAEGLAQSKTVLQDFFTQPDWLTQFQDVFGAGSDAERSQSIATAFSQGNFQDLPIMGFEVQWNGKQG